MSFRQALSFDDVLLIPNRTEIDSRSDLNTKVKFLGYDLEMPILSANMASVTGKEMILAMAGMGNMAIFHRMNTVTDVGQLINYSINRMASRFFGVSFGIGDDWIARVEQARDNNVAMCCLDVAHAHSRKVGEVIKEYWQITDTPLIVGNVATAGGFHFIVSKTPEKYYDRLAVKVGIGGGSLCTTRIQTGHGIPTLQSVLDVSVMRNERFPDVQIVADGGIKNSGDIVKSLAAGADVVMLGSLLAGTDQAPGEVIIGNNGSKFKIYRGSASFGDKRSRGAETRNIEGSESLIPYKGDVCKILRSLQDGILSGLSYSGWDSVSELTSEGNGSFIQITNSGYRESLPHGIL
jgi:IMP dehydrogenase